VLEALCQRRDQRAEASHWPSFSSKKLDAARRDSGALTVAVAAVLTVESDSKSVATVRHINPDYLEEADLGYACGCCNLIFRRERRVWRDEATQPRGVSQSRSLDRRIAFGSPPLNL